VPPGEETEQAGDDKDLLEGLRSQNVSGQRQHSQKLQKKYEGGMGGGMGGGKGGGVGAGGLF
jgi:hypothetical protein